MNIGRRCFNRPNVALISGQCLTSPRCPYRPHSPSVITSEMEAPASSKTCRVRSSFSAMMPPAMRTPEGFADWTSGRASSWMTPAMMLATTRSKLRDAPGTSLPRGRLLRRTDMRLDRPLALKLALGHLFFIKAAQRWPSQIACSSGCRELKAAAASGRTSDRGSRSTRPEPEPARRPFDDQRQTCEYAPNSE